MATFEKDFVLRYGSLEEFAKEDGCYKIYESDSNYHVVRKPADEQGILTSPYVKNPRLVWEKKLKAEQTGSADAGAPATKTTLELIVELQTGEAKTALAAASRLADLGEPAVEALLEAVGDDGMRQRYQLLRSTGQWIESSVAGLLVMELSKRVLTQRGLINHAAPLPVEGTATPPPSTPPPPAQVSAPGMPVSPPSKMIQKFVSAAAAGYIKTVRKLLDRGADVNALDKDGQTPLGAASKKGRTEAARLLLDRGADVNPKDNQGLPPLHWAATNGHTETARLFLDRGAHVNSRNFLGQTPLHGAALSGRTETAALLRERGGLK